MHVEDNQGFHLKKELGLADLFQIGKLILQKTKLWTLIAHDRIMLEQKFHFLVKDLSLNYHLGKEKCKKALKLYEIWLFKVEGVFPILPKLPWPKVSFSYTLCGASNTRCYRRAAPVTPGVTGDCTDPNFPRTVYMLWCELKQFPELLVA